MTEESLTSKVSKGDIVRVEYDAYLAEGGMVFDTTNADKAKEAGIFNENLTYKALPLLVGGGRSSWPGQTLVGAEVGVKATVDVHERRGARDHKLVENVPLREFFRQEVRPEIGMEIDAENRVGTVVAITNRMSCAWTSTAASPGPT